MYKGFKQYIYNRYFLVFILILLCFAWFLSGSQAATDKEDRVTERTYEAQLVTTTRVVNSLVERQILLNGQIFADREVEIKTEIAELVDKVLVDQGEKVSKGQLLIKLRNSHYLAALNQAKALLAQGRIQYDSVKNLRNKQLGSKLQLAEALSTLKQAESELTVAERNYSSTMIRAPFDGVLYDLSVEVGDYVGPGTKLISLLDYSRLIVKADVSQKYIHKLHSGYQVEVSIDDRDDESQNLFTGKLSYIAPRADADARSFPIEVSIDNQGLLDYVGITAQLNIMLPPVKAFKVSPALFELNGAGQIGVKIIDDHNRVVFQPVKQVKSDKDHSVDSGVWVSGLTDSMRLAIAGAGLVEIGELVKVQEPETQITEEVIGGLY